MAAAGVQKPPWGGSHAGTGLQFAVPLPAGLGSLDPHHGEYGSRLGTPGISRPNSRALSRHHPALGPWQALPPFIEKLGQKVTVGDSDAMALLATPEAGHTHT